MGGLLEALRKTLYASVILILIIVIVKIGIRVTKYALKTAWGVAKHAYRNIRDSVKYLFSTTSRKIFHQYGRSMGVLDQHALTALGRVNDREHAGTLTTMDKFTRGSILGYNVVMAGERNIADESNGAVQNIIHSYQQAVQDYNNVLMDIANQDQPATDDEMFMMMHIANFAQAAYPRTEHQVNPQFYEAAADRVTQDLVLRREQIAAAADTKAEATAAYLEAAQTWNNDTQNVHDSRVNRGLIGILNKIKYNSDVSRDNLGQILDNIVVAANQRLNADQAHAALTTIERMRNGGVISMLGEDEATILARAWIRADNTINQGREDNIKEAILLGLADATRAGITVCPNGRAGRVLGALIGTDADEDMPALMSTDAYRNQIFEDTRRLIESEIERASKSDNADLRSMSQQYHAGVMFGDAEQKAWERFSQNLKGKVHQIVEGYSDVFRPDEIQKLKVECEAAI